jgi:hypothetical protein
VDAPVSVPLLLQSFCSDPFLHSLVKLTVHVHSHVERTDLNPARTKCPCTPTGCLLPTTLLDTPGRLPTRLFLDFIIRFFLPLKASVFPHQSRSLFLLHRARGSFPLFQNAAIALGHTVRILVTRVRDLVLLQFSIPTHLLGPLLRRPSSRVDLSRLLLELITSAAMGSIATLRSEVVFDHWSSIRSPSFVASSQIYVPNKSSVLRYQ